MPRSEGDLNPFSPISKRTSSSAAVEALQNVSLPPAPPATNTAVASVASTSSLSKPPHSVITGMLRPKAAAGAHSREPRGEPAAKGASNGSGTVASSTSHHAASAAPGAGLLKARSHLHSEKPLLVSAASLAAASATPAVVASTRSNLQTSSTTTANSGTGKEKEKVIKTTATALIPDENASPAPNC